jgi:hypothetical protein
MAKKPSFVPSSSRIRKMDPRPFRSKTDARIRKRQGLNHKIHEKFVNRVLNNHLKNVGKSHEFTNKLKSDEKPKVVYPYYRLLPTDGDMDGYEKSENYQLPSRIGGAEFGSVIKKYLSFTEGMREDSQMTEAKKLYKSQTYPAFNSEATDHMKAPNNAIERWLSLLYSQTGDNRQGVWFPLEQGVSDNLWNQPEDLRRYQFVSPMLGKLSMWSEIRQNLITNNIVSWLNAAEMRSADIFFAITSIQDVITISNVMKYSPVDLKVYLCRCKSKTKFAPNACWINPTGNTSGVAAYQTMAKEYVYSPTGATIRYPGDSSNATCRVETSVNIASTPKFSPLFRNHWDIVDVINQTIEPTDKFELTIDRHFRKAHSGRDLEQAFMSYVSGGTEEGYWQEGDMTLLVTFRGLPGIMKNTTGNPPVETLREVDHTPAKIMMQSRSSFQISANDILNSQERSGTLVDGLSAYVSSTGRILDTTILTNSFADQTWSIDITTSVENKEGGSR